MGDWSDQHGLHLILMQNQISETGLFVALQTDVGGRGKGLIFSRWGTNDLANARHSLTAGWTVSSGGDFIGVRRLYDWVEGDYRVRIVPDGLETDGEWFSLWVTDLGSGETTWIGSLKFPLLDGTATMHPRSSATIELYGSGPIRPIDIPQWHVSLGRPSGDNAFAEWGFTTYPFDDHVNALPNSNVSYDELGDRVHLIVGGTTWRKDPAGHLTFAALSNRKPIPIPSPTPTPTPTPTPGGLPALPPVNEDIRAALEEEKLRLEQEVQDALEGIRKSAPKVAAKARNLKWVRDGIDSYEEFRSIKGLVMLAGAEGAEELVTEDWVVEGRNHAALESLGNLAQWHPEALAEVLSHPSITDGVSDAEARIVSILHSLDEYGLMTLLLEPGSIIAEEKTVNLPLAGKVDLVILRTSPSVDHIMRKLEMAVHSIEEFMGVPFPRKQVILFIDEITEQVGLRGINYGTHVSIPISEAQKEEYEVLILIAHETGHYYWLPPVRWMSEGTAHFLAGVVSGLSRSRLIEYNSCASARSVAEIEEFERESPYPGIEDVLVECYYSMGERLFRSLYWSMDEITYRLAFRRLYYNMLTYPDNMCSSEDGGICQLREAFFTHAQEEEEESIRRSLSRWYDIPADATPREMRDAPVDPTIPTVNGRVEEAYLSRVKGGPPISSVIVSPNLNPGVELNLTYTYQEPAKFGNIPLVVELYFESEGKVRLDSRELRMLPVPSGEEKRSIVIHVSHWRDLGRFWVHVHQGDRRIVKQTFETLPEPDPRAIRGMVLGPDGQPLGVVALWFNTEEGNYWVDVKDDGAFEIEVPPGTYLIEVNFLVGNQYYFLGWYDGAGITTIPDEALGVRVEGSDIEGIDIHSELAAEEMLCPDGEHRSTETGLCP